ncbi:MAG TPA: hypothetical protein PLB30_07485 [Thermoleophilia bacterium]|nr:hypothetical protein [Thermoleophilia bacterium]HQJ98368.1 hypothetical protein [Thermoleophilia bacterium]
MKASRFTRYAAMCGVLAGLSAIAGGLYAHAVQPEFGIPGFFGAQWDLAFSGVGSLIAIGVVMVVGGVLSFKWPSVGASIVSVAAMVGLAYVFDRGQYRWLPLLYYWAAPWILTWLAGIFAGYALHERVEPYGGEAAPAGGQAGGQPTAARMD